MTAARYLPFIWPASLATEVFLAIVIWRNVRILPWFSAYILFDVGRSVIVLAASYRWPNMLRDPEYCWIFTRLEWPALILLCMAAVEATPKSVRSNIEAAVLLGGGLIAGMLAFKSKHWPVYVEPAFAARVWVDSIFIVCTAVRFSEQNWHGMIMYLFLTGNCVAYGSLVAFHPKDTTVAACFSMTVDGLSYLLWGIGALRPLIARLLERESLWAPGWVQRLSWLRGRQRPTGEPQALSGRRHWP